MVGWRTDDLVWLATIVVVGVLAHWVLPRSEFLEGDADSRDGVVAARR